MAFNVDEVFKRCITGEQLKSDENDAGCRSQTFDSG